MRWPVQLVWWWDDWDWPGFHGYRAEGWHHGIGRIYRWVLWFGPLEIRRWRREARGGTDG